MHRTLRPWAAAGLCAFGLPALAGSASVAFIQPDTYADAAYSRPIGGEKERAQLRLALEHHLKQLAAQGLAVNESLAVEVLDIDLAGHFEPVRSQPGAELRVLRDISGPRIKLRYTLKRGDQVMARAEDQLSDTNYLLKWNRYSASDRLRYEKALLDDWFGKRFGG